MYIPGLPEVARSFAATDSSVQLSITAFLIGLAAGQILLGPISDALGRRLVLLTGTSLFAVFSLICAVAPSIEIFNVARLIEGFSAAAGIAVARAFLTDWFYGAREAARHFSTLSAIVVVAPVAAPILGGMVLGLALWRTIFVVLAVFGFLLAVIVAAWLPESLPRDRRRGGGLARTFKAMPSLLRRRALVGYLLTSSFVGAALFMYISGSAFVFRDAYGVSSAGFTLIFAVNALGALVGSVAFGRLAARVRINTLLVVGLIMGLAAMAVLVTLLVTIGDSLPITWVGLFVAVTGIGIVFPATMTVVQSLGHDAPGCRFRSHRWRPVRVRRGGIPPRRAVCHRNGHPHDSPHPDCLRRLRSGPLHHCTPSAGTRRTRPRGPLSCAGGSLPGAMFQRAALRTGLLDAAVPAGQLLRTLVALAAVGGAAE
jgi:Bcr/CflA subfamily drug resistance transporter